MVTIVKMFTVPTQTSLTERSVPIITATLKGIRRLVRKLAIRTAVKAHLVASIAVVIAHCSSFARKLGQQVLEFKMKCRPHQVIEVKLLAMKQHFPTHAAGMELRIEF